MRPVGLALTLLSFGVALAPSSPALAHERRRIGPVEVVVGWAEEPAIAGFQNEVQFAIEGPGADAAELEVVIVFGDGEASTPAMALEPTFDDPTEYRAPIIPTRPGTYTFEITGEIGTTAVDETFTSGPDTFDDVRNPADLEFPVQDPTRGELAERLERLAAREGSNPPAAEPSGGDTAARWIAAAALLLALVALAASRRRGTASRR